MIKKEKKQDSKNLPDYRHLPTTKRKLFKDKPYTATAKDSTEYKKGFKAATEGKNVSFPSRFAVQGFREAKERGLKPKKK